MNSPEQFLREFAAEIVMCHTEPRDAKGHQEAVKRWAKLLELREQEARVEEVDYWITTFEQVIEGLRAAGGVETITLRNAQLILGQLLDRRAQLTAPNNTSNTLEES